MEPGNIALFLMVSVLLIIINTSILDIIYGSRSINPDTKDGIKMIIRVVSLIVFMVSFNLLMEKEGGDDDDDEAAQHKNPRRLSRTWHPARAARKYLGGEFR